MIEQWTPERIAELRQAVREFNGFCDQYGETHGIDAYGEASADFDEVLTSMFPDGIDPSVSVVEALTDHIESQRLELEAARRVVDAIKVTTLKFPLPMLIEHALDQYHALRSQHAASGCYDPWGLERSE